MARVTASSDGTSERLTATWELARTEAARASDPAALDALGLTWSRAEVPGTVASAMRTNGASPDISQSLDAFDHWYRLRFTRDQAREAKRAIVRLCGLATIAEAWLNGAPIAQSENMFHEHVVDVTPHLRAGDNELLIRFASLKTWLDKRRPRPRFKTRLVEQQQLRYARTTLLGRIPGWTPPVVPVGPWRDVLLEERALVHVDDADLHAHLEDRVGVVRAKVRVHALRGAIDAAELEIGSARRALAIELADDVTTLHGSVRLPDVERWWPCTHGAQPLYDARLHLVVDGEPVVIDFGKVGFRSLEVDQEAGGFALRINGERVFARGVCWTTSDMTTLVGKPEATRAALEALRDAGANMVRVGGTMFYEDDTFYTACDELGLLVWQDFMFANMDYPFADEAFCASVRREADGFCSRTQLSPSIAVFCGNSEGEQQAAMLGLERELWSSTIFSELLPSVVSARRPDVPYWPSSASGGALPFHPDTGTSSYYGVGAYLRDLDDARRSRLRFASECLAFANVPCDETIELVVGQGQSPFHHPKWKERVPRDSGPGWDFEDVRDHYVQRFFNVDPMRLRYADMDRYLALSRVAAGHAMEATFHEWRRAGSDCGGALIWFHRDLWAGPGWGIMDSSGRPKAAYFHLKRAWKPVCLVATDEGLNGITLHAINESPRALRVELNLTLYRHGHMQTAIGKMQLELTGRSTLAVPSDVLLGRFLDTTYAYRFGPPGHDVAHAVMTDVDTGARLGEAFHFPLGLGAFSETEVGLEATASPPAEDGSVQLSVRAHRFAQSVAIDARGYVPSDDFFHLAPSDARTITLRPVSGRPRFSGFVRALNDRGAVRIGIAGGPS